MKNLFNFSSEAEHVLVMLFSVLLKSVIIKQHSLPDVIKSYETILSFCSKS